MTKRMPPEPRHAVVPAQAGTREPPHVVRPLGPRLRGDDEASRESRRSRRPRGAASPALAPLRAALAGALDLAAAPGEAAAFAGALSFAAGRGFVLATLETSAARWLPARAAPAAALLACVEAGAIAAPLPLAAGSAIFLDLAEPFEITVPVSARVAFLATSRAAAAERFGAESLWHGLALDAASAGARVYGAALQSLAREIDRAAPAEAEALAAGLLALAAGAAEPRLAELGAASDTLATLTQVRRFIDANLTSVKLDTAMVARAFGFSHASLYRLFAPLGGVATYIRKARLARARRLVAAPRTADRRLGEIALASGFRSATVFNRLFLAEFGMTPGEARAQNRPGPVAAAPGDGEFAARLRGLS